MSWIRKNRLLLIVVGCFFIVSSVIVLSRQEKVQEKVQLTSTLPIVAIHTDPDNLWSKDNGIYVNYEKDREIPVHVQFQEPSGKIGFALDAGAQIFGGNTRRLPQKSLAIIAGEKYGSHAITYPLFPEESIQSFQSIVLRNAGQDFHRTHLRDGMVATLFQSTNVDVQAYRPVVVSLNGEYWGIHDMREKIDKDFLAAHHDVDPDNIDLLEADLEVKEGDIRNYLALLDFLDTHDMKQDENYQQLSEMIDIDNFIDYVVGQAYIANTDWPDHNIRYWRPREDGGKWRWIVYDTDQSFDDYTHPSFERLLRYKGKGDDRYYCSHLVRKLLENKDFQSRFLSRYTYHMKHTFQAERVTSVIQQIQAAMEPEMERHTQKWGGSVSAWKQEVDKLIEFATKRPEYLNKEVQRLLNVSDKEMSELNAIQTSAASP